VRIVQVPYKGTAQLLTDVVSGQLHLSFSSMASILPHVKSGKLKALGVTGVKRSPAAPEVPTIAEAGVPGYRSINWNGLLAPAATSRSVITTLNREITRRFKSAEAQERFASVGIEALTGTPAEFDRFIREEIVQWAKVIKQAGIKVDLE
jgi:tripartite-type tricarboxylate transporter receptor subunit TctC